MIKPGWAGAIALAVAASSATAEVVKVEAAGFELVATVSVDASPQMVWDTIRAPARWWSADHTYSGDAANLYIDSQATGCFCEKLPGDVRGSIEHARIVYAQPHRMLRLHGALGPLQAEAVVGTLTFDLRPDGDATAVTLRYIVGGYMRGGGEKFAALVDRVLAQQLDRLKAAAGAPR